MRRCAFRFATVTVYSTLSVEASNCGEQRGRQRETDAVVGAVVDPCPQLEERRDRPQLAAILELDGIRQIGPQRPVGQHFERQLGFDDGAVSTVNRAIAVPDKAIKRGVAAADPGNRKRRQKINLRNIHCASR